MYAKPHDTLRSIGVPKSSGIVSLDRRLITRALPITCHLQYRYSLSIISIEGWFNGGCQGFYTQYSSLWWSHSGRWSVDYPFKHFHNAYARCKLPSHNRVRRISGSLIRGLSWRQLLNHLLDMIISETYVTPLFEAIDQKFHHVCMLLYNVYECHVILSAYVL